MTTTIEKKLSQYGQNKSKTWQLVNEITKRKKIRSCSIKNMINENNENLKDPASIADCLNQHFGTVGQKLASALDSENVKTKDPLEYIQKQVPHSIFLHYTDTNKMLQQLSKLDPTKGCGYDILSNRILSHTSAVIAPYLVYLFNMCLAQGVFPD